MWSYVLFGSLGRCICTNIWCCEWLRRAPSLRSLTSTHELKRHIRISALEITTSSKTVIRALSENMAFGEEFKLQGTVTSQTEIQAEFISQFHFFLRSVYLWSGEHKAVRPVSKWAHRAEELNSSMRHLCPNVSQSFPEDLRKLCQLVKKGQNTSPLKSNVRYHKKTRIWCLKTAAPI